MYLQKAVCGGVMLSCTVDFLKADCVTMMSLNLLLEEISWDMHGSIVFISEDTVKMTFTPHNFVQIFWYFAY